MSGEAPATVLGTDIGASEFSSLNTRFTYDILDVRDAAYLRELVAEHRIDTIFHLASLLSASGEKRPDVTWEVNVGGLKNVLDVARDNGLKVFWPSSIAVYGPGLTERIARQDSIREPNTMYGVTKVTGELLCNYYSAHYRTDVRSVRLPGIISYKHPPGGGTTDYAIEMFRAAFEDKPYVCFLSQNTRLPMMYMPDAIRAMIELMTVAPEQLRVRTSYNLAGISFTAAELAEGIRVFKPSFQCAYQPDYRQDIADSWPEIIDDGAAREEWGWKHRFDLEQLTADMFAHQSVMTAPA
jgi:nucleoside-diphosphate-sugar epimerase